MAAYTPVVVLVSNLRNNYSISTQYDGARYNTRVLDGLDNTLDEITGDATWPSALRTHADMFEKYV